HSTTPHHDLTPPAPVRALSTRSDPAPGASAWGAKGCNPSTLPQACRHLTRFANGVCRIYRFGEAFAGRALCLLPAKSMADGASSLRVWHDPVPQHGGGSRNIRFR